MRRLALTTLVLSCVLVTPVWAGPPAICLPFEIGKLETIPLPATKSAGGEGVAEKALAILDGSERVLLHMETLRRAVFWMQQNRDVRKQLLAGLLERAQAEPAGKRAGLAHFDLGFLQGALDQMGSPWAAPEGFGLEACLDEALARRPDDGDLQLGVALARWERKGGFTTACLARAIELAESDELLRRNLARVGKRFFSADSYDEFVAKIRGKKKGA